MTLAWIVLAVVMATLVATAAAGLEPVARTARIPARAVWAAALLLTVSLTVLAPWRTVPSTERAVMMPMLTVPVLTTPTTLQRTGIANSTSHSPLGTFDADRAIRLACVLSGAVGLALLALAYAQFALARRTWVRTRLHEADVRIAPNAGPAVMGVAPPEIIIPKWLLARTDSEQRLVLAHEREHVRAGDTRLLLAACVIVACMPWNVALWYMLRRLRLAVELDCDARVLDGGVPRHAYSELLVALAGQSRLMRFGVPAFAFGQSHLETRIMAMTHHAPRRWRVATGTAIAAISLLAACESKLPAPRDVASTSDSARIARSDDSIRHAADIVASRDRLDHIRFVNDGGQPRTIIDPFRSSSVPGGERFVDVYNAPSMTDGVVYGAHLPGGEQWPLRGIVFNGALALNGALAQRADVDTLLVTSIDSIVIYNGRNTASRFTDPRAKYGVAEIWTKKRAP